jgi:hypothetical protein
MPTKDFPQLTVDDQGIWRCDRAGCQSGIEWADIYRISIGKVDCITHSITVVTLDWDFGEFFEIMDDWAGFLDVANAISKRFPNINPDWLQAAIVLSPRDAGYDVWKRE